MVNMHGMFVDKHMKILWLNEVETLLYEEWGTLDNKNSPHTILDRVSVRKREDGYSVDHIEHERLMMLINNPSGQEEEISSSETSSSEEEPEREETTTKSGRKARRILISRRKQKRK